MNKGIKRIGVLTSGGDAPGMNAAIRAVVLAAAKEGIECLGIRRGYNGLINGDIVRMESDSVNDVMGQGGTILFTARSKEFMTEEGLQRASENCKSFGMDGIVAIGGDGTFRGALALSRYGVALVGIPATIDNDIACSSYTIGYDTACNTAIECIDRLQDTMRSHERCSVVEVMGHRAGHLALYVGVACGATAILIPERPVDFERDIVEQIRLGRLNKRTHFLIIVAEGAAETNEVARKVVEATGIEARVTVLGHLQRGGSPLGRDRVVASRMGYNAVHILANGGANRVVCMQGEKYLDIDIAEALERRKALDEEIYTVFYSLMALS